MGWHMECLDLPWPTYRQAFGGAHNAFPKKFDSISLCVYICVFTWNDGEIIWGCLKDYLLYLQILSCMIL